MSHRQIRRRALLTAAAGASVLGAAPEAIGSGANRRLPEIRLGEKRVTRLVAGANPINGYGHSTRRMDELMLDYFTVERTTKFLLDCEKHGINTWQTSYHPKVRDAVRAAREQGCRLQLIFLTSGRQDDVLPEILALRPIAVVHHGGVTDNLFHTGKPELIHDFVKKIHDLGLLSGVSTHNPDHLARVEDSGWENDFYMTCMYNVTRTREQIQKMLGDQVLGELFLAGDPERMAARIREVKKPCLAFKILAAGRLCGNAASVDRAFASAYRQIKPSDAAIVGLFPIVHDEIAEDAALARKHAGIAHSPAALGGGVAPALRGLV
jgi:hypothetical protein